MRTSTKKRRRRTPALSSVSSHIKNNTVEYMARSYLLMNHEKKTMIHDFVEQNKVRAKMCLLPRYYLCLVLKVKCLLLWTNQECSEAGTRSHTFRVLVCSVMKVNTSLNTDFKKEFEVLLKMASFLRPFPHFLFSITLLQRTFLLVARSTGSTYKRKS